MSKSLFCNVALLFSLSVGGGATASTLPLASCQYLIELAANGTALVCRQNDCRWLDYVDWRGKPSPSTQTADGSLVGVYRGDEGKHRFWVYPVAQPKSSPTAHLVDLGGYVWNFPWMDDQRAIVHSHNEGMSFFAYDFVAGEQVFFEGVNDQRGGHVVGEHPTNPDQIYLLTNKPGVGLAENRLALYDLRSGKQLAVHESVGDTHIRFAVQNNDGNGFWITDSEHKLQFLDLDLKVQRSHQLPDFDGSYFDTSLSMTAQGKLMITYGGASNRAIRLLDPNLKNPAPGKFAEVHNESGWAQWIEVTALPDGTLAIYTPKSVGDTDRTEILLLDSTMTDFHSLSGHPRQIQSLHACGSGKLLSFGSDHSLRLWDVANRNLLVSVDDFEAEQIGRNAIDEEGNLFTYSSPRGEVKILDIRALK